MPRQIHSEIVIDAEPSAVWAVLMDFASHATWNPFMSAIEGQAALGSTITVRFRKGMTFRPTVTAVQEARTFEWLGKLFFGGMFDGRHRFELVREGERTRLRHSEEFRGVLVPLLGGMLKETEQEFVKFNVALKERVERAARG